MILIKFKGVIFDLDGTLLDTIDDLATSVNNVLIRYGFPIHNTQEIKMFVGSGVKSLIEQSLPQENRDEKTISCCLLEMKTEYGQNWNKATKPYEGIHELLDALTARGIKIAVLSNKVHEFTVLSISHFFHRHSFDAVIGQRQGIPVKPDPTAAVEIANIFNILPEEIIYIGDSDIDMRTGINAGMYPVGVSWGFRGQHELIQSGAKKVIDMPMELLDINEF